MYQQTQHHTRMISRPTLYPSAHLKRTHINAFTRADHKVRHVISRQPIPQIRRQQKRLRTVVRDEFAHPSSSLICALCDRLIALCEVVPVGQTPNCFR
jgi:hypothetical protein